MRKWLVTGLCMVAAVMAAGWTLAVADADSDSNDSFKSTHYEVDQSFIGSGGLVQENSADYQAGESIGEPAVGHSASTNYQTNAGYTTTSAPGLSFAIDTANANFGSFSPASTATTTSTFQVADYTSYGYAVQVIGNPPSNGNHTLAAMATTGPPQTGVEQFGINLVSNTAPISFGADPDNGQFGAGVAAANYNTPNVFRYVSGETIASAPKSSGTTTYTISYVANVTSLTPGGQYTGGQVLICTAMY